MPLCLNGNPKLLQHGRGRKEERMAGGSEERKRLDEIFEINRRFVDLIARHEGDAEGGRYGLPDELCGQIRALTDSQRDAVASVPLLLVTVTRGDVERAGTVRDSEDGERRSFRGKDAAEQVFGAALMTWLTQDAQQNHTLSSLWLGTARQEGEPVGNLNFGEIQSLAAHSASILKARFADRPDLWSELLRAAQSDDPKRQLLARLAILPHSHPAGEKTAPGPWRKRRR